MGMFDTLTCKIPLPGPTAGDDWDYQTKDLDCSLRDYVITSDAQLVDDEGKLVEYSGELEFYGGTPIQMISGGKTYTRNGGDVVWVVHKAEVERGKILWVELVHEETTKSVKYSDTISKES